MKKAKNATLFFTFLFVQSVVYAELVIPETPLREKIDVQPHEDELITIKKMIVLTEKQLKAQKKIKILIEEVRENKEMFLKGDGSKLHALYMINAAEKCLALIRKHHLYPLFSSDFMEELAIYTQVGIKNE